MSILQVKNDETGQWINIPALRGKDGVGISSIGYELTDEDGGFNRMSVNMTDGKNYVCGFRNGRKGTDGQDYILTEEDKQEIAEMAVALIPTTEGVEYG